MKEKLKKRPMMMRSQRDVEEAIPIDNNDCVRYMEWLPKALQCPNCKNIYCIGGLTMAYYHTHAFKDKYYYDCPGCDLNLWVREIPIDFMSKV